jgi:GNAT superfamily N-acetyltransferase
MKRTHSRVTDALNRGLCLKKEIGAESDICQKLQFEAVRGIKHLQFLLLEYRFFKESEEGTALPLSLPRFLSPLSLMLHIVKSRALTLLRLPCYFVKLETRIVGLLAIQEHHESLLVASLGVAREYRRLGIGMCILGYIETIAKHMRKRRLETLVLRENIPAQRLYAKYGFTFIKSERMYYIMKKEICVSH